MSTLWANGDKIEGLKIDLLFNGSTKQRTVLMATKQRTVNLA